MGDFEVFISFISVMILGTLVYNVITILSFKDILRRFGFLKRSRRDFYECGFKPRKQKPVTITLQYLLICVFFILYDIELIFLFPFVASYNYLGLYDILLLVLFFAVLFIGLLVEYERHALWWEE